MVYKVSFVKLFLRRELFVLDLKFFLTISLISLFKTININCEFDNNLKNNNYENKTVYYFDDFCGSGEQLIKTLRKLEGSLINCKIKIVIFSWLHMGYQNLIRFLKNI